MIFGARALIRLGALRHNIQVIRKTAPGNRLMAVIKANAYGHGMLEVAKALDDVDSLAVARLGEAQALRNAGVETAIVILEGVFSREELAAVQTSAYEIVVHNDEQLRMLEDLGPARLTVWLKIDTGMNRLGFAAADAAAAISRAKQCAAIRELRLMTHLANADDRQDGTTAKQFGLFQEIAAGFDGDVSIAGSAGFFGWPDRRRRPSGEVWIRPGIALYGISPFSESTAADFGLRPVMQLQSRLIAVKAVEAGGRVGYGGTWQARADSMIGIVAAGYADGYSRFVPTGTPVLVNNRRVPLAGRVSMDMLAVDLGSRSTDKIGDPVLLWGEGLPVEEIAARAGTIAYQLVCGISNREPYEYSDA